MSDGNHMPVSLPVRLPLLVAAITHRVRGLKSCDLRCWFKQVRAVLHLAKCMTAVCGLRLLHFSVEPAQPHSTGLAALRVHSEWAVAKDLCAGPSFLSCLLPHAIHDMPVKC